MKFKTQYDREEIFTNPGSHFRPDRQGILDKKGNIKVVEKETPINQYAYINSFADSCDINVLVARFRAGDKTALDVRAGQYLDISNIPDNFNDLMALHHNLESYFNSLPASVRSAFDNSVNIFVDNLDNPNLKDILAKSTDEIQKEFSDESKKLAKAHKQNIKPAKELKPIENPGIDVPTDPTITPEDSGIGSVSEVLKGMKK